MGILRWLYISMLGLLYLLPLRCAAQTMDDLIEQEMKAGSEKLQNIHAATRYLTANYDLKYQRMEWTVNPSVAYISGVITSLFEVVEPSIDHMIFDLSNAMVVSSVMMDGEVLQFTHTEDRLTLVFNQDLMMTTLHEVVVTYAGSPGEEGVDNLTQTTHAGTPILWTFSEPFGAKEWWPCKQDLEDKIDSIDVFVTVPAGLKVASNGTLESVVSEGGQETHHWKHRFPIPAYLIAFAVTNYEAFSVHVPIEDGAIEILNYVYPENLMEAQNKSDEMAFVMSLMMEYFGNYPYSEEKYGHAEWGRGGGMEHTTMSFMGGFNNALMMHELAHQWFGNKVTCGSWEDIWLNEGFASYAAALYYERKWELDNDYPYWWGWRSTTVDYITSEPDGSVWVTDTLDASRIFDGRLSYRKGAYLLRMLRWEMGDEDFFLAIRNYLEDESLAFGFAVTPDLIRHLKSQTDVDIDGFFQDWYYGEGYPSHQVQYTQQDGRLALRVYQYQSDPSVSFFALTAPIRIIGSQGESVDVRLDLTYNGQFFEVPVEFNVQEVLFDPELQLISNQNDVSLNNNLLDGPLEIEVYPNPMQGQAAIYFNRPLHAKTTIALFDNLGRLVRQRIIEEVHRVTLDVQGLATGHYLLRIETAEDVIEKSLIVR